MEPTNYGQSRVSIADEQSDIGVTTYEVALNHMDHGVVIYRGEDRDRATEVWFVLSHELNVAHAAGAGRVYHKGEQ